eukprot:TRINITY_DN901_c0_g3_i1.p1 TRINITY_DN901_c0_g3~~TRINITY_DN901_c0_g3_i1.p1  ORF type:complete len:326 (+),score=73.53 TRINITY_DN901_c0_g3_i1:55-1032(+)
MSTAANDGKASPTERRPMDNLPTAFDPSGATSELSDRLIFAIPKKGRLYDVCVQLLKDIGLKYRRKPRLDIALCTNMPVALVFLPAADIPKYVAQSHVDLGITGEDMIAEQQVNVNVEVKLGFGKCRLCLQGPVIKDYKTGKDVLGKRIVTSFPKLTKKYFDNKAQTDDHNTKITYVSGSVEAACGLGLADAIVDLVESGDTMAAHHLQVVDTLLETEAVLCSNVDTSFPKTVAKIKRRVQGIIAAKSFRMVTYNINKSSLDKATALTPGMQAPTITPLLDEKWVAVQAMVKTAQLHEVMDGLHEIGATAILVNDISNTRMTIED